MSDVKWTADELKRFKRLADLSGSPRQMDRIESRIEMPKFVKEHGKEKCDAMWKHLTAKASK
jgi:hypothetical protein